MIKKRGSLFFIIDSFIAASIITLTIVMILSFHTEEPTINPLKINSENIITFMQKNQLKHTSGPQTEAIYQAKIIPDDQATILQSIAYLYENNDLTNATRIIEEQINKIIPSQLGINFSINRTTLYAKKEERKMSSKTLINSKTITQMIIPPQKKIYVNTTNGGLGITGDNSCQPNYECIIVKRTSEPTTAQHCSLNLMNGITYDVTCEQYEQGKLIGPYNVEVEIWV